MRHMKERAAKKAKVFSAALAIGAALVLAVPTAANAATVPVPARSCGSAGAMYAYIYSSVSGSVTHAHRNASTGSTQFTSFTNSGFVARSSTKRFVSERLSYANVAEGAGVSYVSSGCDN